MKYGLDNQHTCTVTFRLDSKTLKKLKNYANFERHTLNAVVNQLLSHAINWDISSAKTGWVPVEGSVLTTILDNLDEETIIDIAKMAGNTIARDMSFSMTGSFGVREWVTILRLRAKSAGFGFSQIEGKNFVTFVIKHGMGIKCSLHWKTFYEYGFRQLECPVTFEITENTVVYKIPKKYLVNAEITFIE
ncbi:MAG: hypothetical protein WAN47_00285 [Nitrosotalea sp.]